MRRSRYLFAAALALAFVACRFEAERAMHEPIDMGPFTFAVEGASKVPHSPCDAIVVDLRLTESRNAKVHFDDFLNDMVTPKLIVFPNVAVVGPRGRRFSGWVSRVSGRESWRAQFEPDEGVRWGEPGQPNARQATTVCGSWGPSDFQVVISNPDRRSGQPARVRIPLR